jgi:hypothetical protein
VSSLSVAKSKNFPSVILSEAKDLLFGRSSVLAGGPFRPFVG